MGAGPSAAGLPQEVAAGTPGPASPRRRAFTLVLRVLGLLLLAWVLSRVPWRDRAHLAGGEVIAGTILEERSDGSFLFLPAGEGAGGERRFLPADLAVRPRGLPAVEEGVATLSRRLRAVPTLLVLLLAAAGVVIAALRWRLLLRAQGILLTRREALSFTFLGNFFNQVAPGGILGGDVLKAVYASRGRGNAAGCAVGVFLDRVVGLFGTVVLACAALLPRWNDPRFHGAAVLSYGVLLGGLAGVSLVLSRRVRSALRVERWVPRVPFVGGFLAEADAAVLLYRDHRGAVVLALGVSLLIHAAWCVANALLGGMLGIDLTPGDWFAVVPPILVVSAIPLFPGGWGMGEASYVLFLGLLGVPPAPAVAVSVLGRVMHVVTALPGGIVFLGRRR